MCPPCRPCSSQTRYSASLCHMGVWGLCLCIEHNPQRPRKSRVYPGYQKGETRGPVRVHLGTRALPKLVCGRFMIYMYCYNNQNLHPATDRQPGGGAVAVTITKAVPKRRPMTFETPRMRANIKNHPRVGGKRPQQLAPPPLLLNFRARFKFEPILYGTIIWWNSRLFLAN
jgi:hypothetical protein